MELEGETTVEGSSVDRLIGLQNVRATLALMRTPDGHSRIELDKFHDRRHLAQQSEIIEAPLLDWQGLPRGLRHPSDLALDLPHEQLDSLRRRLGLLLLDLD